MALGLSVSRTPVGVAVDQRAEPVDRRRVVGRVEGRFARRVQRDRVGREIMVERDIFLENNDQMLDRRRRSGSAGITGKALSGEGGSDEQSRARPRLPGKKSR